MQAHLLWSVYQAASTRTIQRHCATCGKTVAFTNSGKIRRNANGKNIFEYAIYRCENGHTWNQKIRQYKAGDVKERQAQHNHNGHGNGHALRSNIEPLQLALHQARGTATIHIRLEIVEGVWRLDTLLAAHIADVSRTKIQNMLTAGRILLNERIAPPDTVVRENDLIRIEL
ncbi:hypothetical protein U14_03982 [Candidatus Moduliflexus flocculans]|uniref:RNA-binding S4 domain-containing protein n=1 Tax=Candidatus Moduliflexus flocculans TaxID=1499966 RepID=A0A0S6W457_9BACT|nr:hypothetical protein U14_03982 [Candidatus Moduliflexus flocculans]